MSAKLDQGTRSSGDQAVKEGSLWGKTVMIFNMDTGRLKVSISHSGALTLSGIL